jgi:SAM-dependent MidA family methyltransferase
MEGALYEPRLGYYSSGAARLGRSGDFFTSVSVGACFGELLADQFRTIWEELGSPAEFAIVEQGAHEGRLAADVLGYLEAAAPECFAAIRYTIVGAFEPERVRQRERLGRWLDHLDWAEGLGVGEFEGVFFCNELIDAFPFHVVRFSEGVWRERCVGLAADRSFAWVDRAIGEEELRRACEVLGCDFAEGYTTEVRTGVATWLAGVGRSLGRGVVLVIDYGYSHEDYYAPERTEGTMRCFRGHVASDDPFGGVGETDITAHVDFTSLDEAAAELGFAVEELRDQGSYLVELARPRLLAMERDQNVDAAWVRQFQTLTHPGMMGRGFKVWRATVG